MSFLFQKLGAQKQGSQFTACVSKKFLAQNKILLGNSEFRQKESAIFNPKARITTNSDLQGKSFENFRSNF